MTRWAKTGCLDEFVRRIVAANGMALSRARAKTKREDACSCAKTCSTRTMIKRQHIAIAPLRLTADLRTWPKGKCRVGSNISFGCTARKMKMMHLCECLSDRDEEEDLTHDIATHISDHD